MYGLNLLDRSDNLLVKDRVKGIVSQDGVSTEATDV
jgi:hypothetical protein